MALIGEMKFLTIGDNTYSIPAISAATSSNLGGIKIGYSTSNKNYAVQLDNNNKAFVNVPWTDTTYSSLAAASGGTTVSLVTTGEKYIWNNMLPLTGGNVSGSVSIDDLTVGDLIVTGNTSFVQGIPFSTITGTPTTISGYGITDAVTDVAYNSSTYNITKTINGTTSNIYQMPCIAGTGEKSIKFGDLSIVIASGEWSLAGGGHVDDTLGYETQATETGAFAWGYHTRATNSATFAVGYDNLASGQFSFAAGAHTQATDYYCFSTGLSTKAIGFASFAIGQVTEANGICSISVGNHTIANGNASMAAGNYTITSGKGSFVTGHYNIEDTGTASDNPFNNNDYKKYAFIIGNGNKVNNVVTRSNALAVDWYGNLEIAGSITLGYSGNDVTTLTATQLKTLISTGTTGQVLTKTASGFAWQTLPIYNGGVS